MISQARKAKALTGILLLIVAGALTGSPMAIEIHQECIDDVNNDGGNPLMWDGVDIDGGPNGDIFKIFSPDGPDPECLIYPWADGNGETHTPVDERYLGDKYASTTFELWEEYLGNGCFVTDLGGIMPPQEDGSLSQWEQKCGGGGFQPVGPRDQGDSEPN